jgi:hypothetical protein
MQEKTGEEPRCISLGKAHAETMSLRRLQQRNASGEKLNEEELQRLKTLQDKYRATMPTSAAPY